MANKGDSYTVALKKSHLDWGMHRYTGSRSDRTGEGYIPIPKNVAERLGLVNSNGTRYGHDELGKNLFRFSSDDGEYQGYLKAQGCSTAGDIYAKQFSADGNLRRLGEWFAHIGAKEGTRIRIAWTSSTDVVLSKVGTSGRELSAYSDAEKTTRGKDGFAKKVITESATEKTKIQVNVGDILTHKAYGQGRVFEVENKYIRIHFESVGDKSFINPDAFTKGFLKK